MDMEELQGATLRETVRKRSDVLGSLLRAPASKPDLVDRLEISRSTVDRAIDALREPGLIRRADGLYHATAHGELLLDCHREYSESTDALAEAAPILDALPVDCTIERALLENGTIRLADPHAPESALTAAIEELKTAERLRVFSPVVKSSYLSMVHEEVTEAGLETDLVLGQEATESLASLATVTETVEQLLQAESFDLFTTDDGLPFVLYLMTGETDAIGVTVHDDGGIVGSVTANDPEAVEWGRTLFEEMMSSVQSPDTAELL